MCAGCSPRSPTGTISSRPSCRTVRTRVGRRSWRRWPTSSRASARWISRPAPVTSHSRSRSRGAKTIGLDITHRMLQLARRRQGSDGPAQSPRRVEFITGDMTSLPFRSASFDLVTTGYGLRNVPDLDLAIDEIARVLRPGGRLLSLDFNRPENAIVRSAYLGYLDGGRIDARLDPASRSRHLSIHSRIDQALPRRARRGRSARRPRIRSRHGDPAAVWIDVASPRDTVERTRLASQF